MTMTTDQRTELLALLLDGKAREQEFSRMLWVELEARSAKAKLPTVWVKAKRPNPELATMSSRDVQDHIKGLLTRFIALKNRPVVKS
jgi:hypothetical protein